MDGTNPSRIGVHPKLTGVGSIASRTASVRELIEKGVSAADACALRVRRQHLAFRRGDILAELLKAAATRAESRPRL
jgi:hypothetical protein